MKKLPRHSDDWGSIQEQLVASTESLSHVAFPTGDRLPVMKGEYGGMFLALLGYVTACNDAVTLRSEFYCWYEELRGKLDPELSRKRGVTGLLLSGHRISEDHAVGAAG